MTKMKKILAQSVQTHTIWNTKSQRLRAYAMLAAES